MALTTDIRAAYNLDESSGNAADSTGNGFTLTNNNTATYTTGLIGNCVDFGSSNTNKYLSNGGSLCGNAATTVSCWVKLNSEIGSGTWTIWSNKDGSSNSPIRRVDYDYNGGTRRLRFITSGTISGIQAQDYTITLGTSNWTHIVFTSTAEYGTMEGWVNGSSIGSRSTTPNGGDASNSFNVARLVVSGTQYASVKVDMLYVWTRVLSSTEIGQLYNGGAGLQYPFTSATGNFLMFM